MFDHVGFRNDRRVFEVSRRCLDDDGLSLLHCIGSNTSVTHTDPRIAKYSFPNSMLPSAAQTATGTEGLFVTEDWPNFGNGHDRTLQDRRVNIEAARDTMPRRHDGRFLRRWR